MGWRGDRVGPSKALEDISRACVKPRETDTGRMGRTREAVLWKFHSSPMSGGGESLEGTNGPTHFGRQTYSSVGKSQKCRGHWERPWGDAQFHKVQWSQTTVVGITLLTQKPRHPKAGNVASQEWLCTSHPNSTPGQTTWWVAQSSWQHWRGGGVT